MRLMFVITRGDSFGGAQLHVRDLTRQLAADGHTVQVIVGATGILTDELRESGIATSSCDGLLREVNPIHDVRAVHQLRQQIVEFAPDLVTTHSSKAGMIGRLAAKWAGVPCVFTVHGWSFIETVPQPIRAVYQGLEWGTAPLASKIICVSNQLVEMGSGARINPKRFAVVHNGIPDIPPTLRSTPGSRDPRAIMVARFAAPKDHATVVRALVDVPGLQLDFVGDGPDEPAVIALAEELGVNDRVNFLGQRSDVAELLAQSHIFILSSKSEGFPISTLEAMRAGLPVVVSDVGGAGESVRTGQTGFLFERGDHSALAGHLMRLAGDTELRDAMGLAGRRLYESEFTFEIMYSRTLRVYESVLATATQRSKALEAR